MPGSSLLRSYKGLKLRHLGNSQVKSEGTCLLRSYKGLKLLQPPYYVKPLAGLLRSYKGLKLEANRIGGWNGDKFITFL